MPTPEKAPVFFAEPRKRGRPRVDPRATTERLTTHVPLPVYDRICHIAAQKGQSVSQVVRSLLMMKVERT